MSAEVLQLKSEIERARIELNRRGISCTTSKLQRMAHKIGLIKGLDVGDEIKSWDILKTTNFIESNITKDAPILDIGAYCSEILCVLHRIGYSNLTGVDLNPKVKLMPYADTIRYVVSDFMHAPFEDDSFDAITSTSVIEHGFNSKALLSEITRLLRPDGCFIASFDYWPEKVDTTGIPFFGMDWKIFSEQEVLAFIEEARNYNLVPAGNVNLKAQEKPINCANRDYTFAWLALKKGL